MNNFDRDLLLAFLIPPAIGLLVVLVVYHILEWRKRRRESKTRFRWRLSRIEQPSSSDFSE